MSRMTLPSRHKILNSNLGGLRPSTSRRLPTILSFTSGWGRNIFVSFKPPRPGNEPRTLHGVKGSTYSAVHTVNIRRVFSGKIKHNSSVYDSVNTGLSREAAGLKTWSCLDWTLIF